ncbi:class I SAM-dependent methyltransferase [Oligoflexia bacterium]|nr:class I SAM-dependent methyltransferase [Oligoflexia bacterium]
MLSLLRSIYSAHNEQTRDRWVIEQLQALEPSKKLLDAGCGTQPYRQYCQHLEYAAQDFGGYNGSGDGDHLQTSAFQYGKLDYKGDIWDIDEKDGNFDCILCTEVLEHIPYPEKTLFEFTRLLKKGGVLILTAPYCCIPHMTPYFFSSGFAEEFYKHFLAEAGFQIESINQNGNAFLYLLQEFNRSRQFIKNPILKLLYTFGFIIFGPLLKLLGLSPAADAKALHFGYHVKAVKRS